MGPGQHRQLVLEHEQYAAHNRNTQPSPERDVHPLLVLHLDVDGPDVHLVGCLGVAKPHRKPAQGCPR